MTTISETARADARKVIAAHPGIVQRIVHGQSEEALTDLLALAWIDGALHFSRQASQLLTEINVPREAL